MLPTNTQFLCLYTEDRHVEVHVRIIYEGVKNMKRYIDDNYICKGATIVHQTGKTVMQIGRFSHNYNPSEGLGIRNIYQNEILDICKIGSYIGLRQLFQAANVLQNPFRSVYPKQGNNTIRKDTN